MKKLVINLSFFKAGSLVEYNVASIETAGKRERSGDNSHRGMPIEVQA